MSSAAKAKMGALYTNAHKGVEIQNILHRNRILLMNKRHKQYQAILFIAKFSYEQTYEKNVSSEDSLMYYCYHNTV